MQFEIIVEWHLIGTWKAQTLDIGWNTQWEQNVKGGHRHDHSMGHMNPRNKAKQVHL